MPDALALSWSGGKDSSLALASLRAAGRVPGTLLTVVDEASGAVAHHGIPRQLLAAQAAAVGLELVTVAVPRDAANEVYEARLRAAFGRPPLDAVEAVAFGDLFLADLRGYREERMAAAGLRAEFPLWHRDTTALAREFVMAGFQAIVVSVDGDQLSHDFLGASFDERLLAALPADVDACGENGEFHTFVHDGPPFGQPVAFEAVSTRIDGRFAWLELGG